ncbi:MAG: zinc/manganese transport system permease protein [Acidimicrobiaceae bacterium]|jgi:zinc/manganese transport system permease protein
MTSALIAGTAIALSSGLVGYFLVLRRQLFTGDALSHVAFTGALGALAAGYDLRLGLFVGTVAISLLLGALGPRGRADDVVIGGVFAWVLGLGVLFLSLYTSSSASATSSAGVSVLFGSILGLDTARVTTAVVVAVVVCVSLIAIGRPLLFASIDEAVAAARGVPVRALGYGFLVLVGLTAAEAAQAVGALLLLGLLAAPAGVAHRVTARPLVAFWLSGGIAVAVMWAGLWLSYASPKLPPSFAIVGVATVLYLAVLLATTSRRMIGT